MLASSPLKPSAPSLSLLRFLRSQTEAASFFFSPNHHGPPRTTASSPEYLQTWNNRAPCSAPVGKVANWTQLHCARSVAQVEASLSPLDLLSSFSRRQPKTRFSSSSSTSALPLSPNKLCISSLSHRHVSTKSRPLLRRLLDFKRAKENTERSIGPELTSFTDDGVEGNLFNLGRTLGAQTLNEPRLRCTEFDENGNVTLVNGEYRKSELIAKYGLLPRDLRKIDSSVLPHILVRPSAILISLLHLRVLIKSDRVLVFDAYGSTDSYTQSVFMYDLEGKLRQKQMQTTGALPYELRALEAVLISVTTSLEGEFEGVREPVVRVLRALEEDIDRDKLRHLLVYSKKLGSFEQKARLVRDAIDDLLEADDDLSAMYLTERAKGIERDDDDHQEVEMLLESYDKVCDEIVQASGNLVTAIRNTEEVVKAILDANRNSLMLLDLKFSIGTLGLAAGTLVSALYGMNLKNFIEESDLGFGLVSAACFVSTVIVCIYGLMKLRKVQRVRMWGEGGDLGDLGNRNVAIGGRRNWRSDTVEPMLSALPGEGRVERMRRFKEVSGAARNLESRRLQMLRGGGVQFPKSNSSSKSTPASDKKSGKADKTDSSEVIREPAIPKA